MRVVIEEGESQGCWSWIITKLSVKFKQKEQALGPWSRVGGRDLSVLGSVTCESCDPEQVTSVFCSVV